MSSTSIPKCSAIVSKCNTMVPKRSSMVPKCSAIVSKCSIFRKIKNTTLEHKPRLVDNNSVQDVGFYLRKHGLNLLKAFNIKLPKNRCMELFGNATQEREVIQHISLINRRCLGQSFKNEGARKKWRYCLKWRQRREEKDDEEQSHKEGGKINSLNFLWIKLNWR